MPSTFEPMALTPSTACAKKRSSVDIPVVHNNKTYLQSGPRNHASCKGSPRCTSSKRVTSITDVYQQGPAPEMVGQYKGLWLSARRNSNQKRPTRVKLLATGARHVSLKVKGPLLGLRVIGVSVASQQVDPN